MAQFAPKSHLTAPVWNWGPFYTEMVEQVRQGTWKSGSYWNGIDKDIVGLAPFGPMVPEAVKKDVETRMAGLKDGSLKVFAGPVKDQAGAVKVAEGKVASDEELLGMTWFVQGVVGTTE